MHAKDCQVTYNGQPVQNFVLINGNPVSMRIEGINPYGALGLLSLMSKSILDALGKDSKFEMGGAQQGQAAKIEICGVAIDAEKLKKIAEMDATIEEMRKKIDELRGGPLTGVSP